MVTHSSASPCAETPHVINSNNPNNLNKPNQSNLQRQSANRDQKRKRRKSSRQIRSRRLPLSDDVKRRAIAILNNQAIKAEIRSVIRYGLEINDPWTPDHVRRVEAGENILDNLRPQPQDAKNPETDQ
jgi:hypothetical protein